MASPESITALDYIESQSALEDEARRAMPYDPKHCTYHDGPIRQQLFACLTCKTKNKQTNAICYSCSIQCHSDHDLVELFTKRGFSCDCGTQRMKSFGGCNLRKNFDALDPAERSNQYGHNFEGRFCSCDSPYEPLKESGIMFQCLFGDPCAEDWYHEECILGVERGSVQRPSKATARKHPEGVNVFDTLEDAHSENVERPEEVTKAEEQDGQAEDDDNEDENDTIPGLPNQNEFDSFVCWKCVDKHKAVMDKIAKMDNVSIVLKRQAATPAIKSEKQAQDDDQPASKKIKLEAPETEPELAEPEHYSLFLKEGYEQVLSASTDPEIVKLTSEFPFFAQEEEIYEPPPDDDANSSLLDAGTRALNAMPREQAISGLAAYELIRQRLTNFLRPFAEEGKVVTETDVNGFFEKVREEQAQNL